METNDVLLELLDYVETRLDYVRDNVPAKRNNRMKYFHYGQQDALEDIAERIRYILKENGYDGDDELDCYDYDS